MNKVNVSSAMTLSELRNAFNSAFPHLKLAFYTHAHARGHLTRGTLIRAKNMQLGKLNPGIVSRTLILNPVKRLGPFEQEIRKKFGLNVQVLRRTGEYWMETTDSDELTLEQANSLGATSLRELPENYYDENLFQDSPYNS